MFVGFSTLGESFCLVWQCVWGHFVEDPSRTNILKLVIKYCVVRLLFDTAGCTPCNLSCCWCVCGYRCHGNWFWYLVFIVVWFWNLVATECHCNFVIFCYHRNASCCILHFCLTADFLQVRASNKVCFLVGVQLLVALMISASDYGTNVCRANVQYSSDVKFVFDYRMIKISLIALDLPLNILFCVILTLLMSLITGFSIKFRSKIS